MSDYKKYMHVEKLESDEVDGILLGDVYVFPKIDGSNSKVWGTVEWGETVLHFGSRNRELSLDNDNAGFMAWAMEQLPLYGAMQALNESFGPCAIFGEWLVPHSLKTYRKSAWRNFYVFDVFTETGNYLEYNQYSPILENAGVEYIPPLRIIRNPSYDNLLSILNQNNYLIEDGAGIGEGVVLKNYDFVNKYGRTVWAKIVTSEFKEKHIKAMGAPAVDGTASVEDAIVEKFFTNSLAEKVHANILNECGSWDNKYIQRLLSTVWHDFIAEYTWDVVKEFKNPTVDFKKLSQFVNMQVKKALPVVFSKKGEQDVRTEADS